VAVLCGAGDHGGGERALAEPEHRAVVPVLATMASPSASL
jgi:hypothetical protein